MKHTPNIHNTEVSTYLIAQEITEDKNLQDKLSEMCEKEYATSHYFRQKFHKSPSETEFVRNFMQLQFKNLSKQNKKLKLAS